MKNHFILRVVSKALIPLILLFAFYVQFHGDYGPGGGFQAGVILGSGFILYALVFGLKNAERVTPARVVETLCALGVLIYAGTGIATLFYGGNFLEYGAFHGVAWHAHPTAEQAHHFEHMHHAQHLGINLVEVGVGTTVTAVMMTVFYAFAGRKRVEPPAAKTAESNP